MTAKEFQSTLPERGETPAVERQEEGREISIHSPRAGRDYTGATR